MARVNVEENAFGDSRLPRFARLMSWDHRTALGCLVLLWHDSQARCRIDGTADEIGKWCWSINAAETAKVIAALEDVQYVTLQMNGKYLIHGNETQIENLITRSNRATKGGAANRAKWDKIKAARKLEASSGIAPSYPEASTSIAPSYPQDSPMQSNAGQCRAMQGNAGQCRAETLTPPARVRRPRVERPLPAYTDADLAVGTEWLTFAQAEAPWAKNSRWTPEGFAGAIAALRLATGLNDQGTAALLAFIKADDFWRCNAVSPFGLLHKSAKNGNRKVDNILLRMKPQKTKIDRALAVAAAWVQEETGGKPG